MRKNTELEAPEKFFLLTEAERKKLTNQCGPDGQLNRWIPNHLLGVSISESCDRHDIGFIYAKNQGDHREVDRSFLRNMDRQVKKSSDTFLGRIIRMGLARIYYFAVRGYSVLYGKR